ncbi:MAG: hypothetical protein ACPGXY_06480, partial [Alphaproteobacteria bacterium]
MIRILLTVFFMTSCASWASTIPLEAVDGSFADPKIHKVIAMERGEAFLNPVKKGIYVSPWSSTKLAHRTQVYKYVRAGVAERLEKANKLLAEHNMCLMLVEGYRSDTVQYHLWKQAFMKSSRVVIEDAKIERPDFNSQDFDLSKEAYFETAKYECPLATLDGTPLAGIRSCGGTIDVIPICRSGLRDWLQLSRLISRDPTAGELEGLLVDLGVTL